MEQIDFKQNNFLYGIIGTPGSGKSTLIETLILCPEFYCKHFNSILYITPSKFDHIKLIEDENWYRGINVSWIFKKINDLDSFNKPMKMLIVIDDCAAELKLYERDKLFLSLIYNRRHITENVEVSIMIVSQKYNLIPLGIRTMFTGIFLFRLPKTQIDDLFKDVVIENTIGLKKSLESFWRTKHDFVHINNDNNKIFVNFKLVFI